jgi:hypothetical protein
LTYAELINKVLRKLREQTIDSSVPTGYPELAGQIVNEVKEEIEDMGPWYALRTTINSTLSVGTATLDLTASTDERSYLLHVENQPMAFITTADAERRLTVIEQGAMDALRIFSPSQSNSTPCYVSFSRAAGGVTATFFPSPDAAYATRFVFVVPQAELTAATTDITIPSGPVWREAIVRAMEERGEEFAGPLDGLRIKARDSLNSAIMRDYGSDIMTFVAE